MVFMHCASSLRDAICPLYIQTRAYLLWKSEKCPKPKNKSNKLHHQPGDMYTAATVTFVQIYDKIMTSDNAAFNHQVHKRSILVLPFTKHVYSIVILVILDTSTNPA